MRSTNDPSAHHHLNTPLLRTPPQEVRIKRRRDEPPLPAFVLAPHKKRTLHDLNLAPSDSDDHRPQHHTRRPAYRLVATLRAHANAKPASPRSAEQLRRQRQARAQQQRSVTRYQRVRSLRDTDGEPLTLELQRGDAPGARPATLRPFGPPLPRSAPCAASPWQGAACDANEDGVASMWRDAAAAASVDGDESCPADDPAAAAPVESLDEDMVDVYELVDVTEEGVDATVQLEKIEELVWEGADDEDEDDLVGDADGSDSNCEQDYGPDSSDGLTDSDECDDDRRYGM